jgi:hypothetical protein
MYESLTGAGDFLPEFLLATVLHTLSCCLGAITGDTGDMIDESAGGKTWGTARAAAKAAAAFFFCPRDSFAASLVAATGAKVFCGAAGALLRDFLLTTAIQPSLSGFGAAVFVFASVGGLTAGVVVWFFSYY